MTEIDMADIQHFIWHLHDETRWPAKYYKAVINYALAHVKDPDLEPPEEIHWTRCCREYHSSGESANK